MAIVKISALPAAAAVVATDLVPIVDDPSGVPATQKATWSLARDYVLGVSGGNATIAETITAPTFIGALQGNADTATSATSATTATTATNATNIGVTDAGSDTTTWVLLATGQTGTQGARTDTGLTYNASTNTLTATTFVGSLTGNALTATNATNIGVTDSGSDAATWVLLGANQTGTQGARTDGGLTYNASTNTLTAATFAGALSGNADTATSATTAGTVTTAAQPAITSVGSLTSLAVSGSLTVGGSISGPTSIATTGTCSVLTLVATQSGWTSHVSANATGSYINALGATNSFRVLVDSTTELTITATEATFAGRIIAPASTSGSPGGAGFRLTPGSAPITFTNGDMWTDGSNVFIRLGGVTKTFTIT